jgi:hypothetical protein
MLVQHRGAQPHVHPSAYVAPTAVFGAHRDDSVLPAG